MNKKLLAIAIASAFVLTGCGGGSGGGNVNDNPSDEPEVVDPTPTPDPGDPGDPGDESPVTDNPITGGTTPTTTEAQKTAAMQSLESWRNSDSSDYKKAQADAIEEFKGKSSVEPLSTLNNTGFDGTGVNVLLLGGRR